MPNNNSLWPESYGFSIYGDGPCYVVAVLRGSIAHNAGILPGDQLLELDGHNVVDMSVEAIKTLARHSHTIPPTLGVAARGQYVELAASKRGFGFTAKTLKDVVIIDQVEPDSAAHQVGIKHGDVILEINGKKAKQAEALIPFLRSNYKKLILAIIPVNRKAIGLSLDSATKPVKKNGSRVQRARDLFAKMNVVLGNDYERKMAIVALLKQYAEDRSADVFARSLAVLLNNPQYKPIIRDIRQFVPVQHRTHFDHLLNYGEFDEDSIDDISLEKDIDHFNIRSLSRERVTPSSKPSTLSSGILNDFSLRSSLRDNKIRHVTVHRQNGSYGFVLKGHDPVSIESISPRGPADRAGLIPGDAILKLDGLDVSKCSHNHLIKLLQSGSDSPSLEVLQLYNDDEISRDSHTSSTASISSDTSSSWLKDGNSSDLMSDGQSFKERVDHLLTTKEKAVLRKVLENYKMNRNVIEMMEDVHNILDSPSKKTLWSFIIPKLSPDHQHFAYKYIDIPKHQTIEAWRHSTAKDSNDNLIKPGENGSSSHHSPSDSSDSQWDPNQHIGSFKQQLEYLLTSRERSQLKKALQIYAEKRDPDNLLEDLEVILDTPSKRTLWFYIIPLLSSHHQRHCQRKLGLPVNIVRAGRKTHPKKNGSSDFYPDSPATPREGDVMFQAEKPGSRPFNLPYEDSSDDEDLISNMRTKHTMVKVLPTTPGRDTDARLSGAAGVSTVTLNPVYVEVDATGNYPKKTIDSAVQTLPMNSTSKTNTTGNGVGGDFQIRSALNHTYAEIKKLPKTRNNPQMPAYEETQPDLHLYDEIGASTAPQNDKKSSDSGLDARNSISSYDSFQTKAMWAIKALDDVVANEPSELDYSVESKPPPVAPPPPQPPIPPPPAPPPLPTKSRISTGEMNVKRINWEKIERADDNTVWAKIEHVGDDLDDVVKFLELEQQFSTKKTKIYDTAKERKYESYILSPKKAYNISILLGHLKKTVVEIKESLYKLEEEVLNAELLKQLLSYLPDDSELEKYEAYKGKLEDLSKADQFMIQLIQVPGYDQRLKAMLFKANFAEKSEEIRENLRNIKKASQELMGSEKLEKILELVLAMGNYMNKGNDRIGAAAGFRISFLSQLESTKTADNKTTFLHVLADAVFTKFPEHIYLAEDIPTVHEAAKISSTSISEELQELRKVLQEISTTVSKLSAHKQRSGVNDNFHDIMGRFISQASDEIQVLFSNQATTMEEFSAMVTYFGEDPKGTTASEFFGIFSEFAQKFEKAHNNNVVYRRNLVRDTDYTKNTLPKSHSTPKMASETPQTPTLQRSESHPA